MSKAVEPLADSDVHHYVALRKAGVGQAQAAMEVYESKPRPDKSLTTLTWQLKRVAKGRMRKRSQYTPEMVRYFRSKLEHGATRPQAGEATRIRFNLRASAKAVGAAMYDRGGNARTKYRRVLFRDLPQDGIPLPGEPRSGCRCDPEVNGYGFGWLGGDVVEDGQEIYLLSASCPVHGKGKA